VATITSLEEKRKQVQVTTQQYQNERNTKSKAIGQAKARCEDTKPLMDAVASLGTALKQAETELEQLQIDLNASCRRSNIRTQVPDGATKAEVRLANRN
jgi:seryl-tRNA synthetase